TSNERPGPSRAMISASVAPPARTAATCPSRSQRSQASANSSVVNVTVTVYAIAAIPSVLRRPEVVGLRERGDAHRNLPPPPAERVLVGRSVGSCQGCPEVVLFH